MKGFLRKVHDSGEDVYASLLAYCESVVAGLEYRPAEILFNRKLHSKVPRASFSLHASAPRGVREDAVKRQSAAKQY